MGPGSASRGIFELSVTDAGDITPVTDQDITLCAGESITVGPNTLYCHWYVLGHLASLSRL